jgi:hypothetical protein
MTRGPYSILDAHEPGLGTGTESAAVNADIPNCSVRKSGMLKIIEVLEGRWEMLAR